MLVLLIMEKFLQLYGKARTAILNLDKSALYTHASSVNNAPFAWKRDNTLVLVVDNLMFSYETSVLEDGDVCVVIHEVAENGIIVNEVHNKLKLIIKEALKECLYDFC